MLTLSSTRALNEEAAHQIEDRLAFLLDTLKLLSPDWQIAGTGIGSANLAREQISEPDKKTGQGPSCGPLCGPREPLTAPGGVSGSRATL